jgi:hypothetical protein
MDNSQFYTWLQDNIAVMKIIKSVSQINSYTPSVVYSRTPREGPKAKMITPPPKVEVYQAFSMLRRWDITYLPMPCEQACRADCCKTETAA